MPDGSKKRCYAHRLVATAFVPGETKDKNQVNHKDGNKLNNSSDNLEWITSRENIQHSINNELRKIPHVFCFTPDKKLIAEYKSIQDAVRASGLSESIIGQELNKEIKTLSGGFYWSREREIREVKNYLNTGKAKEVYQYDLNGKFITSYPSTGIAAKAIGVKSSSHIGECCRGKIKSYKGFIWRYVEDIVQPFDENQRDISEIS